MDTDMDICRLAHTRFVISEHDAWLLLNRRMTDFSSALVTRVASLRDNPQYSDLEIITPTRSFHAHKIILSARSSDWGRGVDLSTSVVLDWKAFSDQTCEDILDYIYLDEVKCLVDKTYDDVRVIELLSCASFFSLDELVSRCEVYLEESKARYPLEPHSPAVLMTVALQASSKNLKIWICCLTFNYFYCLQYYVTMKYHHRLRKWCT